MTEQTAISRGMELATARLRLRPFTWADLDALAHISADPEARRWMWAGALTREQTAANLRHWHAQYAEGLGFLAVVHKTDNLLIGQCGLEREADRLSLGYMLHKQYWGQGLATEAARAMLDYGFAIYGADEIWGCTHVHHHASQRVLEKLGMRYRPLSTMTEETGSAPALYFAISHREWVRQRESSNVS